MIQTIRHGAKMMCVALFVNLCGCDKESGPKPLPPVSPPEIGKAQVWLTMGDRSKLLSRETDIPITAPVSTTLPTITISVSEKLQEIDGFGAALTGSSAYLMNRKLTANQRSTLLRDLFDRDGGIGISYLRLTMGASDFSLSDYTYNDMPAGETDYGLANFSIAPDKVDIVPVLKQVKEISSRVKVMATPWSAPAWMKTNGSLKGGKLKPEAYGVYADYFVRYIQAMEADGIAIEAITPQNEPLYFTAPYPCMEMSSVDQLNFIKNHLGPAFKNAALETKIIVYDHNWDHPEYAIDILNDTEARQYVAGSAFHAYDGNVSAMTTVHQAHTDKGVYFTEISGGAWATDFSDNLQWNMANIFIGTTRNWSKTALLWNIALDENYGPTNNGCQDCRGVVTIHSANGSVTRNVEYYAIGHFAKFVYPGARRIGSAFAGNGVHLEQVAFENTDGTKVLVIANNNTASVTVAVKDAGQQYHYSVPQKAVVTIVWE